ncbi:MAG: ABC transporter substrate-binding protein [Pseudomonadota bacterium]
MWAALLAAFVMLSSEFEVEARTLRWAAASDAVSLDPHTADDESARALIYQIYEGLTRIDENRQPKPLLARGWTVDETGLTWRFFLRAGVRFQDGRRLRADDVVFSLERALALESPLAVDFRHVSEVSEANDLVVKIVTSRPDALLPARLASVMVVSRDWLIENDLAAKKAAQHGATADVPGDTNWRPDNVANGTGPYKLVDRLVGISTTLVVNPDYWATPDARPPELRQIEFLPMPMRTDRAWALDSGKLDMVFDPAGAEDKIQDRKPFARVVDGETAQTLLLGFNTKSHIEDGPYGAVQNPFVDPLVRRAIAKTVDAEAIRNVILGGKSLPSGLPIAPEVIGWADDLDQRLSVDLEGATELLAEAGYEAGFATTLHCPAEGYQGSDAICLAIMGMMAQVGIDVTIRRRPMDDHFALLREGRASFFLLPWSTTTFDSRQALEALYHTADGTYGGVNFSGHSDADLDHLIRQLGATFDADQAQELMADAWSRVLDDMVYVPLHHQINSWLVRKAFRVDADSTGLPFFTQAGYVTPAIGLDEIGLPPTGP